MTETPAHHWDGVYVSKSPEEVSWFQAQPVTSLRLIRDNAGSVIDIGAGASVLVDELLLMGRTDLTLLDVSAEALAVTARRLVDSAIQPELVVTEVLKWRPCRTYDVWHDRAVFHFLTEPQQQAAYAALAAHAVSAGGVVVLGTFAADGPDQCSGLRTARYSPEDLAGLFSADFTLEHAEAETHTTPWGSSQRFTWVVLRRTTHPKIG